MNTSKAFSYILHGIEGLYVTIVPPIRSMISTEYDGELSYMKVRQP